MTVRDPVGLVGHLVVGHAAGPVGFVELLALLGADGGPLSVGLGGEFGGVFDELDVSLGVLDSHDGVPR